MLQRMVLIAMLAYTAMAAAPSVAEARAAVLKQGKPFLLFVAADQKVF
ncbi:MAG TPA: hypothetical protein VEJ63_11195 [Planctomycetota bacterium]|nr:hypothetical protein [Planctomycetota bacterium]